jgi:transposase
MGLMPLGPQKSRKRRGGRHAARSNISDTHYTIQPIIPRKRNQIRGRPHNAALYRERNSEERFFCRLKHFRAVATRYDERATIYQATVLLASVVLCL